MVNEATAFLEHLVAVPGTAPPPGTARLHEAKLAKLESEASKSVQCSVGEEGAGALRSGAAEGSLRGLVQHHRNLQLELDAIAARAARHELTPGTTPDRRASRSPGSQTQTTLPPFSAYSASEPYEFQHAAGASAMVLIRSPAAPSPPPSCSEWRSSTPSSGTSGLQTSDLQSRLAEIRARRLSNGLAASPDLVASPSAPALYASRGD
jgi:hypothetical protein